MLTRTSRLQPAAVSVGSLAAKRRAYRKPIPERPSGSCGDA